MAFIRRVGLFRVAIPDVCLPKRYGSVFRIGAYRAHGHEFSDFLPTSFLHEVNAHHQVVVEETPGVLSVGANAPTRAARCTIT